MPGQSDVPTFLFSYSMIGLFPVLSLGWKVVEKSKWRRPREVDLRGEVEERGVSEESCADAAEVSISSYRSS